MNFVDLHEDIYYCLFNQISNVYTKFLHINKKLYKLREQFLIKFYYEDKSYRKIHKKRHPIPLILLIYYNPERLNHTKIQRDTIVYMMEFIANKNRNKMIYYYKHSNHKKLIRWFCERQNLLCNIIMKKKPDKCCRQCKSEHIECDYNNPLIYHKYKMYCIQCNNCKHVYSSKYIGDFRKVLLVTKTNFIKK